MNELAIDLETYSDVDLAQSGVYRYAESEAFEILLFGVSVDRGPVRVYDLASGEKLPAELLNALVDDNVIKWAFNAAFERVCISYWLRKNYPEYLPWDAEEETSEGYLNPVSWRCSMVWAAYLGLPHSLEKVGEVLQISLLKMKEGKELIRYFCSPCQASATNGGRTRNLPIHAPDRWKMFRYYNERDVYAELQLQERLNKYIVPDFLWDEYALDQEINDRGVLIDCTFMEQAIHMDVQFRKSIMTKLQEKTGLANPKSVVQFKIYLEKHGICQDSLCQKDVDQLLKTAPEDICEVLELRKQLMKNSVRKYQAMQDAVCRDGRLRGMFRFYGASRSGRWSAHLVQLQNLPKNHISDLEQARKLVKIGDFEMLDLLYDPALVALSELVRTALVARPGFTFLVADYAAIEARVLAYLAGETWRIGVFASGEDIYCASASRMFRVPVEKNGINQDLREKGKIAELALGYGGGIGALKSMGAAEMGISEEDLQSLVASWRVSNPHITRFWWDVDQAIRETIRNHTQTEVRGIRILCKRNMLFIHLPSGRALCYVKPRLSRNRYGNESITYEGTGPSGSWGRIESYGPKFVENIVQAVSRDILAHAMKTLRDYRIIGHVHDELLMEIPVDSESNMDDLISKVEKICSDMCQTPEWIRGLTLDAEGYCTDFYRKQ